MIQVVDNFNYRGKKPNFDRDSFDTLQDMKNYSENSLDDGHISYCKETDKHYKFNSNNQSDPTTGKWVEQHEAVPADEEDITEQNGTLQLANKTYNKQSFSGLGRVYLRKNIVDEKNILTQNLISKPNTIYIIQYNYDLNGAKITIPENCVLDFQGGSLRNGSITFNNTKVKGYRNIFNNISINGYIDGDIYFDWFTPYKVEDIPQSTNIDINDNILNNIINYLYLNANRTNQRNNIIFGKGIYPFNNQINIQNGLYGIGFYGKGMANTALIFPNSYGFRGITGGDIGDCMFKDFWIEANGAPFSFYVNPDNPNADRFNALHDSEFINLGIYSRGNSDFVFGANMSWSGFLYHNKFDNIGIQGQTGQYLFHCVSSLGTVFSNIYDLYRDFKGKNFTNASETILFGNCDGVFIRDSNFTYNRMKQIFYYTDTVSGGNVSNWFYAQNCNFEDFTDTLIKVEGNNSSISIEFENCSFVTRGYVENDISNHIDCSRVISIKGVPEYIYDYKQDNSLTRLNTKINIGREDDLIDIDFNTTFNNVNHINTSKVWKHESIPYLYENGEYNYFLNKKNIDYNKLLLINDINFQCINFDIQNPPTNIPKFLTKLMINIINATEVNYTINGEDFLAQNTVWGMRNISPFIILKNNTNKLVIFKTYYDIYILPGERLLLIDGGFVIRPKSENNDGTALKLLFDVSVGDEFLLASNSNNRYKIYFKGCGIYTSNFWQKEVEYNQDEINPYFSYQYINESGYIYKVINSGTSGSIKPSFSTTVNSITVDGTVQWLCLGKAPIICPIRVSDYSELPTFSDVDSTIKNSLIGIRVFVDTYSAYFNGSSWITYDNVQMGRERAGNTASRPSSGIYIGFQYFDTDLIKPIWWIGSKWIDATGATV